MITKLINKIREKRAKKKYLKRVHIAIQDIEIFGEFLEELDGDLKTGSSYHKKFIEKT